MPSVKSQDLLRSEARLEDHRRRAARLGRLLGVVLVGAGLLLAYIVQQGMALRAVYSTELLFMSAWALSAGVLMVVLGVGGAARVRDVPVPAWGGFAVVSAVLGLVAFIPLGRLLAGLAGFSDL